MTTTTTSGVNNNKTESSSSFAALRNKGDHHHHWSPPPQTLSLLRQNQGRRRRGLITAVTSKDDDTTETTTTSGVSKDHEANRSLSDVEEEEEKDATALFLKHWIDQLKSPPNIITVSRIAAAPVLSYLIIAQHHEAALIGCAMAGISDVLDGHLAKRYNMTTVLGTYLDPLADKITINTLSLSLWCTSVLPTPLVTLWLVRDIALTTMCYRYVAENTTTTTDDGDGNKRRGNGGGGYVADPLTTPLKVNPTTSSKVNTVFQFITLSVAIVHPHIYALPQTLNSLCWITGVTTCASAMSYVGYSAFSKSGNVVEQRR